MQGCTWFCVILQCPVVTGTHYLWAATPQSPAKHGPFCTCYFTKPHFRGPPSGLPVILQLTNTELELKLNNALVQFSAHSWKASFVLGSVRSWGTNRNKTCPLISQRFISPVHPFYLSYHSYKSNPWPPLSVLARITFFATHAVSLSIHTSLPLGSPSPPWGNWDFLFHAHCLY